MSEYVYDAPQNPAALARHPYQQAQLVPQPNYFGPPQQLGAESDAVKTLKDVLIIVGICLLAYWMLFSKSSPLSNPRHGRNAIAKVSCGADGAWYWKLLRRGARRHGPFGSAEEAESDAEGAGHRVLT